MVIRIKCTRCAKTLDLDPAFSGMRCRCRHCRALLDVPSTNVVKQPVSGVRPLHPPMAEAGRRSRMPSPVVLDVRPHGKPQRRRTAVGIVAGLAICASIIFGIHRTRTTLPDPVMQVADAQAAAEVSKRQEEIASAIAVAPKSDSGLKFADIPVEGRSVAMVIDSDDAMADGRLDEVSLIAFNFVADVTESGGRMWLGLANDSGPTVVDARDASAATINGVRAVMFGRFARGNTNLVAAVQSAAAQRTDELFLVFAHRLQPRTIEMLAQAIQQSGATTHVVAMGEAASQDLSALVAGTHGSVRPLLDEELHRISQAFRPVVAPKPRGEE